MKTEQQKQIREVLTSIFPIRADKEISFEQKGARLFVFFPMHWKNNKRIEELNKRVGKVALFPQGDNIYMFNVRALK